MTEEEVQEAAEEEAEAVVQEAGDVVDKRLIVEGLLFSASKPLRIADIEDATTLTRSVVRSTLRKLSSDYRRRKTAIEIVRVGSRWTMQLKTDFTPHARAVAAPEVPATTSLCSNQTSRKCWGPRSTTTLGSLPASVS